MPFLAIPSLGLMRLPLLLPRDGSAEADEAEWEAIERNATTNFYGVSCGVPHTKKAHPKSYRPDIPLRLTASYKALCTLTREEKAQLAGREVVWRPVAVQRT